MPKSKQYIFQSERLGFRNWITNDIEKMTAINEDVDVMHYFASTQIYGLIIKGHKKTL